MDIKWKFRLPEPMASITQITLCENINFWMEQRKYWFYGYKTSKNLKAVVWDRKVSLLLVLVPSGSPIEKAPIAPIPPPQPKRSKLTPERQKQLDELETKLAALKATLPPPLADESVYWNHIDPEVFVGSFEQLVLTWNNRQMELKEKFPVVIPLLVRIYNAVKELQLPDELMRDDTQFSVGLARMLQYVQIIEENASLHHQELSPEIHELGVLLDDLTDRMIEGGNQLFGTHPEIDKEGEEYTHFADRKFTAEYGLRLTTDQRLDLLDQLGNDPCADDDDRINFLEKSIRFIWQEVEKKPKTPACPHKEMIERHLEEIAKSMKELEETGEETWQLRIAEEMIESANNWRESGEMRLLTKEEFAPLIILKDLIIETKQMEDGTISCKIELFFHDKEDSFAGHTLYAKIENGETKEIQLMG